MARLIDADALIKVAEAKKFAIADNTHPYEAIRIQGKYFREAIDDAPTVDAVPVVPGRWIWKGGCFHCSRCKTTNDHTPKYCEGCGAKMDLEVKDA